MNQTSEFYFTSDGIQFHTRPISPSDKDLIRKGFGELSERSKYLRFFAVRSKLTIKQLKYFTEVDGINHVAWGIQDVSGTVPKPVGIGRFVRLKSDPDIAEIAIAIVDSYQKKGMGRMLFSILNIVAANVGIKKLRYHILADNLFVLKRLERFEILNQIKENQITIVETKVLSAEEVLLENPGIQAYLDVIK